MDALMLSQPETVAFGIAMGEKKAKAGWVRQIVLAFWAGAFIAFAAEGSNMAAFNLLARPETYGLGKCLAGTIFPVGLMLVMLTGAELFTGNTLMCMALAEKRITLAAMLRNWLFVYIGNFLGSLFLAHMIVTSGQLASGAGMLGGVTLRIAASKVALDFLSAFYLGLMCNWLVCLAVWFCWSARSQTGKMLGIFFPIWLFITSGFEHSVANMYYIPAGIMAAGNELFAKASGLSAEALASLTWGNFAIHNLIPVTLGNIAGGALFVGMIHWWTHRGGTDGQTGSLKNRPDERLRALPDRMSTHLALFPAEDNIKGGHPCRLAPLDAVYQPFQGGMSSDDGDHTQIRTGNMDDSHTIIPECEAVDTIFFHDIAPPQALGHLGSEGCRIDILG